MRIEIDPASKNSAKSKGESASTVKESDAPSAPSLVRGAPEPLEVERTLDFLGAASLIPTAPESDPFLVPRVLAMRAERVRRREAWIFRLSSLVGVATLFLVYFERAPASSLELLPSGEAQAIASLDKYNSSEFEAVLAEMESFPALKREGVQAAPLSEKTSLDDLPSRSLQVLAESLLALEESARAGGSEYAEYIDELLEQSQLGSSAYTFLQLGEDFSSESLDSYPVPDASGGLGDDPLPETENWLMGLPG